MSTCKNKKKKTSKFVDGGSNNRNEREGNQQHRKSGHRIMEKKNKTYAQIYVQTSILCA